MNARPIRSEAAAADMLAASLPTIGASFHKPAPVRARRATVRDVAGFVGLPVGALVLFCALAMLQGCGGGDIPADAIATIPAAPASAAAR